MKFEYLATSLAMSLPMPMTQAQDLASLRQGMDIASGIEKEEEQKRKDFITAAIAIGVLATFSTYIIKKAISKKCPKCKGEISNRAIICRWCRHNLVSENNNDISTPPQEKFSRQNQADNDHYSDQIKIHLVEKHNIRRNDTLDGYIFYEKIYPSLLEALKAAEKSDMELNALLTDARNPQEAYFSHKIQNSPEKTANLSQAEFESSSNAAMMKLNNRGYVVKMIGEYPNAKWIVKRGSVNLRRVNHIKDLIAFSEFFGLQKDEVSGPS